MSINVNVGNFIPTNVVEVGNEISVNQLAAITSADSPSGLNPFSTASHIHTIANVSGLQTAIDGKAGISHTHTISSISDLQVVLDGKASVAHTHTIGNITGLSEALSLKADVTHTHTIANITGLQTALDGKASTTSINGKLDLTGGTMTGGLVFALNDTDARITFNDGSIQSTASYSKEQSDAYLATVVTWLSTKANLSGDTFTGKVNFTPYGGVAGLNIGIGGTENASTTAGDLWITTGGANLNFRDGTGAWKVVASTQNDNVFNQPQVIDTNNALAALRVTQRGNGNALVVEDSSNPDTSALIVDKDGNMVLGGNNAGIYKLRVNGTSSFESTLYGVSGHFSDNLFVQSKEIKNFIVDHMFSGNVIKSSTQPITATVGYTDSNYNYYQSGGDDYILNTIPFPQVGTVVVDISWNGSSFSSVLGTPDYVSNGTLVATFTDSNSDLVSVYSDGIGGVYYDPPSN